MESIKNQTFKDFEVWVIDGKSSEKTQDYLQQLSSPFYYISEKDNGIYDAMNKGIDLSNGEWLYFLGAGDTLKDNNVLAEVFSNSIQEKFSLIAGKIIYEGDVKPFVHSSVKKIKEPSWSSYIWIRNSLHHQGTFYKKDLFLNFKYNLDYKILSDYWLNILFFKNNKKCFLIDLMIAKCNSDGVSKNGSWEIYKEEVHLKINQSSIIFSPLFYSIIFVKFALRKFING